LPDTPASRTLFVGLQDQDSFYDTDSYEYSIVTIQFTDEVYNDPLDFPSVVDVVRAGPNPRGFLWNHAGDRLLALNHFYIDYNLSETVDTVSVLQPVEDSETAAQHWRPAGDKRPPLPLLAPAPARWWMWLWPSKWREVVRYLVGDDPVAATLAPEADFVAIANRGSDSVSFIDLTTGGQRTFDTEARPGAVAFTNDHKVVMPVSVIDLQTGESKTVYKSLSMDEWIE
jgi:DNA-binding beta-propeller fold protein YncE